MSEQFLREITDALIRHRFVPQTNTPPDVLALHMYESLRLFEASLLERKYHPFYRPGKIDAP